MEVTNSTAVFIQSTSANKFCPLEVVITLWHGGLYKTDIIDGWYNFKNNSKLYSLLQLQGKTIRYNLKKIMFDLVSLQIFYFPLI